MASNARWFRLAWRGGVPSQTARARCIFYLIEASHQKTSKIVQNCEVQVVKIMDFDLALARRGGLGWMAYAR